MLCEQWLCTENSKAISGFQGPMGTLGPKGTTDFKLTGRPGPRGILGVSTKAFKEEDCFTPSKPKPVCSKPISTPQVTHLHVEKQIGISVTDDDDACIMCEEFKADVIFAPCGHQITCSGCCHELASREFMAQRAVRCPKCQIQVSQTKTVKLDSFRS